MTILVLDQAAQVSGFSIFCGNFLTEYGHFDIPKYTGIEERLCRFLQQLNNILNHHQDIDMVVFEDIQMQHGNVATFKTLAYIQAAIMIWCYNQNIKYTILAPSHWRKILKDKYNINFGRKREEQKQAAVNFVKDKYNLEVTQDEADAICMGIAYQAEIEKRTKSAF